MLLRPTPLKNAEKFAFPLQCIALKLNGSWPLDGKSADAFALFYILLSWYVIASVALTVYFQFEYLIYIFGDVMKTTENCCTTFMGILNLIRLLHMRMLNSDMKELIEYFARHIWIPTGKHRKTEQNIERNMLVFRIQSILTLILISMYCTLPIVEIFLSPDADEKPFPYKMIFFFNAQRPVLRYVLTYAFTAMAGVAVVTTLFAEDSLFGYFVNHCCGQFEMLGEEIGQIIPRGFERALLKYGRHGLTEARVQQEYNRELHVVIRKHNILLNFCEKMNKFYSPIMLVNFTISSILICMVGFQIVTGKMFIGDLLKFIVYIISSFSQLFVLCWNGDALIQYSLGIPTSLYACNWEGGFITAASAHDDNTDDSTMNIKCEDMAKFYDAGSFHPPLLPNTDDHYHNGRNSNAITTDESVNGGKKQQKFKIYNSDDFYYHPPGGLVFNKKLTFMIMRSQKPCKITAMQFSVLSLQSFRTIIGTSMSYFTLLQSLLE